MITDSFAQHKLRISIFLLWLFNISGIIGIAMGYETWFLPLTPLNLIISFVFILIHHEMRGGLFLALLIPFILGMVSELAGVNFGLIFGNYSYGENLGAKLYGVPWIIGVNWATLTYCTAAIARQITQRLPLAALIGSLLMVLLDLVIEQVAPRFDFWEFNQGIVPLQNYVGWLVVAFLAHILFQKTIKSFSLTLSLHIYLTMLVFFLTFLVL
ncbi:carotenoid biosynthesis protein [Aquimarina sp. W85]|uniref:carotenoid biosynthesis protein n=1 Tax=Aquimarina rhodophyticola TaxID=3342246 RepID=UPI0036706B9E